MKSSPFRYLLYIPVLLVLLLTLTNCHQDGCTNKKAINYNSTADKDDGTCIVCNGTLTQTGVDTFGLVDQNFSSPFYNQTVADFIFTQVKDSFNNEICGSGSKCNVYYKIKNLVNKQISFDFNIQASGGQLEIFNYSSIAQVGANKTSIQDSIPANNIVNPCAPFGFTFFNVSSNQIVYQ